MPYIFLSLWVAGIAAYFTNIFWCFDQESWGMLIISLIAFPVGVLHGVYLWFQ